MYGNKNDEENNEENNEENKDNKTTESTTELATESTTDSTTEPTESTEPVIPQKKKRGRKPKPKPENVEPHVPKKRGRKPKGGKIINNPLEKSKESEYVTENVILHLKCNSQEITNDEFKLEAFESNSLSFQILDDDIMDKQMDKQMDEPQDEPDTVTIMDKTIEHAGDNMNDANMNDVNMNDDMNANNDTSTVHKNVHQTVVQSVHQNVAQNSASNESNIKHISDKVRELQKNFYFNDSINSNSACFWCTCEFDHTSVHIPKYKLNEEYYVYGCYCSPECAAAYLFNETIDSSQKFERYQLMNYLYNTIYSNTSDIKPAPNPHYMLDKFMGNMTIHEYRQLLRQDRLFVVVDKPITRILPEIYEETDSMHGGQFESLNNKSTFQIKRSNVAQTNNKPKFF